MFLLHKRTLAFLFLSFVLLPCGLTVQRAQDQGVPGAPWPATSESSDQQAGSVLIYPIYASAAANASQQNTSISLTNTHTRRTAAGCCI